MTTRPRKRKIQEHSIIMYMHACLSGGTPDTSVCVRVLPRVKTHTFSFTRTRIQTYIHTYLRTYIRTYTTNIHTVCVYICIWLKTYIHTHACVIIYVYVPALLSKQAVVSTRKKSKPKRECTIIYSTYFDILMCQKTLNLISVWHNICGKKVIRSLDIYLLWPLPRSLTRFLPASFETI